MEKRILFTVHTVKLPFGAGDIFIKAWDNFLKHHKKDLECDVAFLSGGYQTKELKALAPHCDKAYMPYDWESSQNYCGGSTIYGHGLSYPSIMDADGYDYIIKIDHDAFTDTESINKICRFIRKNEIDFLSPTNSPRGITFSHPLTQQLFRERLFPFGYTTNNGDLWCIRREFFKQLCLNYSADPRIPRMPYLLTHELSYLDICKLIGVSDPQIESHSEKESFRISVDGWLQTDAFAHFCAMKPIVAGVLDKEGRSFLNKNLLTRYNFVFANNDYLSTTDGEIIRHRYPINININYIFHMEGGYTCHYYYNAVNEQGNINPYANIGYGFRTNASTTNQVHYCIYMMLAKRFATDVQKLQLEDSMVKLFRVAKTNIDKLIELDKKVRKYYTYPLREYLE